MSDDEDTTAEHCPNCGSALTPIAYGMPGLGMREAADRGEVVLGGCTVYDGQPTSYCTSCGTEVGSRSLPWLAGGPTEDQ